MGEWLWGGVYVCEHTYVWLLSAVANGMKEGRKRRKESYLSSSLSVDFS